MDEDLRARVLKRDGFHCAVCGSIRNIQIHHVFPKLRGGEDTFTNLVVLCSQCHSQWEENFRYHFRKLERIRDESQSMYWEDVVKLFPLRLNSPSYPWIKEEKHAL